MHNDPRPVGLAASAQDYEALVRLSEEPLGIAHFDGRLQVRNGAWERTFVSSASEPHPSLLEAVHPGDREKMRGALRRCSGGEDVPELEVRCLRRDGIDARMIWRVAATADKRRCLLAGRDAARSHADASDLSGDRRLSELGLVAAVVAHDLNNVLSIIRGCASMIRILPGLTPAQTIELDDLSGGVRHGTELVRQVFDYGRRKSASGGEVDINKIVADMGWMLRRLGRGKVCVDLVLGRGLGPIKAEEVQVEQVLFNLAVNACEAMSEGGRLRIETCGVPGNGIRLLVADTGTGIPPEIRERLFEPFLTTKPNGTGLGLFSVWRIVQQCGAEIRVRSRPREGAVFEIDFPRAGASGPRTPL